jgi:hypothetical protein
MNRSRQPIRLRPGQQTAACGDLAGKGRDRVANAMNLQVSVEYLQAISVYQRFAE